MIYSGIKYYINPHYFTIKVNDMYYLLINPVKDKSVRLINKSQKECLISFKNESVIPQNEKLDFFIHLLENENIISRDNSFSLNINDDQKFISFWIHSTDECNLDCKYCYIKTKQSRKAIKEEVRNELFVKIINTVRINRLNRISLRFAGGEPFLNYKPWIDRIQYLKNNLNEYGCDLKVSYLTNLTIINDDIINFIKLYKVNIFVSLDGIGNYHDVNRSFKNGKGSFINIVENLKVLEKNEIYPFINAVISNDNIDGLEDFVKFIISHNYRFRFSIVQDQVFDFDHALEVFYRVYKRFKKEILSGYTFSKNHRLCDLSFYRFTDRPCSSGRNSGVIYIDGKTYFCQKDVGSDKYTGSIYDTNNLFDLISNGDHYNTDINNECIECRFRYICNSGCPLNRINGKSPACSFYKEIIPLIYKLIGLEKLIQLKKTMDSPTTAST